MQEVLSGCCPHFTEEDTGTERSQVSGRQGRQEGREKAGQASSCPPSRCCHWAYTPRATEVHGVVLQ